jgi:hypothetical protein
VGGDAKVEDNADLNWRRPAHLPGGDHLTGETAAL